MEDYKKKYENALERANTKIETYNRLGNASMVKSICDIFPELKESEDERVRKSIIDLVEKQMPKSENKKWMIAWLEKQGEKVDVIENFDTEFEKQVSHLIASIINKEYEYTSDFVKWTANTLLNYAKNELEKQVDKKKVDNVKSKFNVGDWIVYCNETVVLITGIKADGYIINKSGYIPFTCQGNMRLWTIQDAKDGDVLCDYSKEYNNPLIFILKKFEHVNFGLVKPSDYSSYCFLTAGDRQKFKEGSYHHKCNIKPATKEQRDQLEKAMKEAGYEWDAKKKELKKIEQTYFQKQEWTCYDEKAYEIALLDIDKSPSITKNDSINWLKSLKERMKGE